MAKQLSAFILLLLILCLPCSTMSTGARTLANEVEQVRKFDFVRANSKPIRPSIIQNQEHSSEQATDTLKVDGKALSVPQAPQIAEAQLQGCEGQTTWSIAKPSTGDERLDANIQYCCTEMGMNCSIIQPGGSCYEPIDNYNHASVVMNLYY